MKKLTNYKKFLFGLMAFAMVFAVGGALAINARSVSAQTVVSGPTYVHTVTLRVGSSGTAVVNLQAALNYANGGVPMLVVDGKFGPRTLASVQKFQVSKGLVMDGIVGPRTGAALSAATMVVVTSPLLPAGCTSTAGYSSTTGVRCDSLVGTGLPAGCTSTAGYSPTTGVRCDSGVSGLPAGCSSTAGYSPTTGVKCDSTVTTPPVSPAGEGSVALSFAPVPSNNLAVNRGESKDVVGIEVKGTGSDMRVNRLWLDVDKRIWLSANSISLLDGGTVIATVPLSSATVIEVTPGSKWQIQFNNLNVLVPVNTTKVLTVRINRPELTSANDTITLETSSTLRATDAAGFSQTYNLPSARTLNMANVAASTGELTTTLAASSPEERSVTGLSTTAGVLTPVRLLDFNLTAKDGVVNATSIAASLAASGTCTVPQCVASVELRDGTTVLSSVSGATSVTFSNLNVNVAAGTTKTLSIWGQMNHVGAGAVVKGDSITASVTAVTATSGPSFVNASTSNTVTGQEQHLFEHAPIITLGSTSASNTGVDNKDGTYSLSFSVTAPASKDIFVEKTPGTGIVLAKTQPGVGGSMSQSVQTSNTTTGTWGYKILAGQTATFTVTALVPAGGSAGFTGVMVTEIEWNTVDSATGKVEQTWGIDHFRTPEVFVRAS